MDIEQIIASMTPELYQRLATAVELGKMAGRRCADPGTKRKQHAVGDVVAGAQQHGCAAYDHRHQRSDGDEEQTAIERGFRYRAEADCDVQTAVTCRTERPV